MTRRLRQLRGEWNAVVATTGEWNAVVAVPVVLVCVCVCMCAYVFMQDERETVPGV